MYVDDFGMIHCSMEEYEEHKEEIIHSERPYYVDDYKRIDSRSLNDIGKAIKKMDENRPLTYDNIFDEMMKRMKNFVPTIDHKCMNCGGVVVLDMNKHIFNCPYCDSVYAIGTKMINDR